MTTILYMFWRGFSEVSPTTPVYGPIGLNAAQVYAPGARAGVAYVPGACDGQSYVLGLRAGEVL